MAKGGRNGRTESEKFELIEKAVYMRIEGHDRRTVIDSLGVPKSTYDKWHASDDWKQIEGDIRRERRDEMHTLWRNEMHTAVKMVKRMCVEGDPNNPVFVEALKFIVESQGLGPKGESNDKEISSGPAPIAIQINQGTPEALQLRDELRSRLGGADGSVVRRLPGATVVDDPARGE